MPQPISETKGLLFTPAFDTYVPELTDNANIQNAFIITNYKGLDPEVNGGIDNNFYPRPRTIVLGLNLNF